MQLWPQTERGFELISKRIKAIKELGDREFDMAAALAAIVDYPYLAATPIKFCFDSEAVNMVTTYLQPHGITIDDTVDKYVFELLKDAGNKKFSKVVDELGQLNRRVDNDFDKKTRHFYTPEERRIAQNILVRIFQDCPYVWLVRGAVRKYICVVRQYYQDADRIDTETLIY